MASQAKRCTPRAVVTPMRISRGDEEEEEGLGPPAGGVEGSGRGSVRIPESVSLWPAVGLDVCRAFGLRHHPLPSAQACLRAA